MGESKKIAEALLKKKTLYKKELLKIYFGKDFGKGFVFDSSATGATKWIKEIDVLYNIHTAQIGNINIELLEPRDRKGQVEWNIKATMSIEECGGAKNLKEAKINTTRLAKIMAQTFS